ncbi:MAG: APC family permease [Dactylosporangium sp.]|nr:APC family permease [Dactylosporangium sp.]NNJ63911.1 APC family permease [Dactylosporangium sp.]
MPVSTVGTTLAADRLGASSVASFALNAAAPIMVVGAYVTTAWAVTGAVPVSLALLGMGAILAIWAVGYLSMARHVVNAGSLYTFLAHGLGPRTATTGAAVQLLAYSMLQWGLYGIVGVQASALAADHLDVHLPWWAWALLAWTVVAWLGTRGVVLGSRLLTGAIIVETLLVGLIIVVDLAHPAPGGVSFAALDPTRITSGSLGALIAISVTAFVGIEAAPVYSEEARQPKKTIMVATYLALILMVVVYVAGSWAMSVAVGPDQVIATAAELGPDMLLVPASTHLGGTALVDIGHILLLTSISAGLMAYHNAVARTTFSLARDRVLPRALARTSPRSGAPVAASLAQSATGLAVILVYAMTGWDPTTRLFFWLGTTGALGVLVLMTGASLAVVGYFARDRRGESPWATRIAPSLAGLALTACVVLVVDNYAGLLGVAPTSPARWALPASYLVVAGLAWAWSLSGARRRPHALRRIGRGANAAEPAPLLGGLR